MATIKDIVNASIAAVKGSVSKAYNYLVDNEYNRVILGRKAFGCTIYMGTHEVETLWPVPKKYSHMAGDYMESLLMNFGGRCLEIRNMDHYISIDLLNLDEGLYFRFATKALVRGIVSSILADRDEDESLDGEDALNTILKRRDLAINEACRAVVATKSAFADALRGCYYSQRAQGRSRRDGGIKPFEWAKVDQDIKSLF